MPCYASIVLVLRRERLAIAQLHSRRLGVKSLEMVRKDFRFQEGRDGCDVLTTLASMPRLHYMLILCKVKLFHWRRVTRRMGKRRL